MEPVDWIEPGNWTASVLVHLQPRRSHPALSRALTIPLTGLAALAAAIASAVESAASDHLNGASGLQNVYLQLDIVKKAYQLLNAETRLRHIEFDGEHQWRGIEAVPWTLNQLR